MEDITMNAFKVTLLLSYICIASISAAIITPALPHIQTYFHLSNGSVEWVVSIFLLGYVIGQLIYGPIANKYGRIKALRIGLIINIAGILICMLSTNMHNYSILLLGRLITALGAASGLSCTFMLINELLPADRAKHAISLAVVSFTAGIGLAVLLGGIITQYFHWQDIFALLIIHGVAMLIATALFPETLKEPKSIHPKAILTNYTHAFTHKKLIVFSLAVGFVSLFSYGYSASAPIYAQKILKLTAAQYGYWNTINMIGMCCGGFLCAKLLKKFGERRVLTLSLKLITPAILLFIVISLFKINYALLYFATTSYLYLITGLLFPSASYFASTAIGDKASASSVMSFINMGSAMIGVIVMGYLPFSSISSFTLVCTLFFILVATLCICFLNNKKEENHGI